MGSEQGASQPSYAAKGYRIISSKVGRHEISFFSRRELTCSTLDNPPPKRGSWSVEQSGRKIQWTIYNTIYHYQLSCIAMMQWAIVFNLEVRCWWTLCHKVKLIYNMMLLRCQCQRSRTAKMTLTAASRLYDSKETTRSRKV